MTKPNIDSSLDLKAWKAQTLRMTAILSPAAEAPSGSVWEELFGESPESINSQPKTGIRQEQGFFRENKLIIAVQPIRIDFIFTADDERENTALGTPIIGIFVDSLNPCVDLVVRWLQNSPPVQRLAFGANLLLAADSQEAAYEQLFKYLRFDAKNFDNAQDFFYQINRPRDSTTDIAGLKINRLSRWAVTKWTQLDFIRDKTPSREGFFCSLELDINTSIDFEGELPKENLAQIFLELVQLAKEIAEKGEI